MWLPRCHPEQSEGPAFPLLRVIALLLLCASAASAGILTGTVKNGTNGKPVANETVVLISLQGGMQELTSTKTDAGGHYEFNRPEIGQGPLLVKVTYQTVGYFQPVPPGRTTGDVTVYDSTSQAGSVQITSRTIIFQPNGQRLLVGEDFVVENNSNPPVSYANNKGTFEFGVPEGADLGQVSATSPGGMPLTQGTMDKGKNRYAIDFAIKPGETNFRVAYDLPYSGDKATVRPVIVAPAPRVMVAAPVGVQISGDGFSPSGSDQGFTLLTRQNLGPKDSFSISIAGAATLPAQNADAGQPAGRDAGNSAAPAGEAIQVISPRISSFQWIILGGMGLFFLAGFFFLMKQPQPATAAAALPAPVAPPQKKSRRDSAPASVAPAHAVPASADPDINPRSPSHNAAASVMQEAERGAQLNLEQLKDTLFRLELRRQAGTITDDDYARERSRIESLLRDLVRG